MGGFLLLKVAFWSYVALFAGAALFDIRKFIIPNWISLSLVALFVAANFLLPISADWLSHFAAMGIALLIGFALFRFRVMGGGDIKLLAAAALWAGTDHLLELVIYIGVAGGAFALALIVVRRLLMSLLVTQTVFDSVTLPRLLLLGEQIPYGVAIAGGAILLGRGLPHLGLFL